MRLKLTMVEQEITRSKNNRNDRLVNDFFYEFDMFIGLLSLFSHMMNFLNLNIRYR